MTAIDNDLVKADLFRLLSSGFSYPTSEKCDDIRTLIQYLLENFEMEERETLERILQSIHYKEILRAYSGLFLKGTIPTTETAVCEKMNCLPDVAAFYKAFGMNAKSGDSPDSITYQLEFASLLLVKKVLAKNEEQSFVIADAYKKFMADHLTELAVKFNERLKSVDMPEFYCQLSNLLIMSVK